MYEKKLNTGYTVEWNLDEADEELAVEAMEDIDGTEVPGNYTLPEDAPVPLDAETVDKVRKRYRELHIEKYGEESKYYEVEETEE